MFFYRLCWFLVTQWDGYVNLILQRVITWRRKTKESKFVLLSSKCAPKFFVQPLVYVFPEAATGCWAESCLLIETNKLRVHHSQGFEMAPNFTQESIRIDYWISLQQWHNLSAEWVQYFCTFFQFVFEVIVQKIGRFGLIFANILWSCQENIRRRGNTAAVQFSISIF